MTEGRIEPASRKLIARMLRESWGLPVIAGDRVYDDPAQLRGLVWREATGDVKGLVTWATDGEEAEIVSIEALEQGRHIGGRLLDAAEAELRRAGVRRVIVVTTNDNLRALAFYVRRGYRLVSLHLDGMDRVRAAKPQVPQRGKEGIPLRGMWELEKEIC